MLRRDYSVLLLGVCQKGKYSQEKLLPCGTDSRGGTYCITDYFPDPGGDHRKCILR